MASTTDFICPIPDCACGNTPSVDQTDGHDPLDIDRVQKLLAAALEAVQNLGAATAAQTIAAKLADPPEMAQAVKRWSDLAYKMHGLLSISQSEKAGDARARDWRYEFKQLEARLYSYLAMLPLGDEPPHTPRRSSDVEAWLKAQRDRFDVGGLCWHALNDLLDDYRDHADTGTPLTAEVVGPHPEG